MEKNRLYSLIDKAIFDYRLIEPGDKILIGASGGKDSTALIEYFANRMRRPNCDFTFTALYIHTDFASPLPQGILEAFKEWNVDFKVLELNTLERVKPGQKMSCYWCSSQRRLELNRYAAENGYNKVCLGHHLDDILETVLMNALHKGVLSTMIPRLKYDKFPVTIIRPLCYAPVEVIIEHAKKHGYYGYTCTCNYQDNSDRKSARKKLEVLTDGDEKTKMRLMTALKNVNLEYLP